MIASVEGCGFPSRSICPTVRFAITIRFPRYVSTVGYCPLSVSPAGRGGTAGVATRRAQVGTRIDIYIRRVQPSPCAAPSVAQGLGSRRMPRSAAGGARSVEVEVFVERVEIQPVRLLAE